MVKRVLQFILIALIGLLVISPAVYADGVDDASYVADIVVVNTGETATFYPDPDVEVSSVDGKTEEATDTTTWATMVGAAGDSAVDNGASGNFLAIASTVNANEWDYIDRSAFLFNTGPTLPDTATIQSATLSVYGTAKTDTFAPAIAPNINVYASTPASNVALVAGDYAQVAAVPFCNTPITYAGWDIAGYNNFTLNAAGLAAISKTGVTKFSLRNANYDVAVVTPTWSASHAATLQGYFADQAGTANDPKLVVTYAVTALTNVTTVCPINTQALIDGKYVTSDLLNTALQTQEGSDVPYMPGVGANPWVFWVPSIGANESKPYLFYTGGPAMQTGHYYFPAAGGMTSNDNDVSLELGNSFTIEQSGYVDTSAGSNKNLVYKDGAFRTFVNGANTITSIIYASPITYYPNPHVEVTSVDGNVYETTDTTTWATMVGAAGDGAFDNNAADYIVNIVSTAVANTWADLYRGVYLFDTSALPDGAYITSATFSVYGSAKGDDFVPAIAPNVNVYSSIPALNTALDAGDYDAVGEAAFCDTPITYAGWNIAGYNNFTLNAAGLAAISKTGVTKFSMRNANYDVAVVTPTWSATRLAYLQGYFADQAGTANDPKLVVTYSCPPVTATLPSSDEYIINTTQSNINNPGFEVGNPPPDWTATSCTIAQSNAQAHSGTFSMKETANSGGAWGVADYYLSNPTLLRNKTITFGAWVWNSSTNSSNQRLRIIDSGGASQTAVLAKNDAWTWYSLSRTIDAAATYVGIEGVVCNGADLNDYMYVDDVENWILTISIDGVAQDANGGATVPNNGNNWSFITNGSMPYMNYHKIWVNGTLVQHIVYERDTTFDDLTTYNNDATPTFVTTSSDPDVSATLQNFRPIIEAKCTVGATEEEPEILPTTPEEPESFFGGAESHIENLPGAAAINDLLDSANIPQDFFWILTIYSLALGAVLLSYHFIRSSLLWPAIVGGAVIAFFSAVCLGNPIPFWTVFIYGIRVTGWLVSERTFGW